MKDPQWLIYNEASYQSGRFFGLPPFQETSVWNLTTISFKRQPPTKHLQIYPIPPSASSSDSTQGVLKLPFVDKVGMLRDASRCFTITSKCSTVPAVTRFCSILYLSPNVSRPNNPPKPGFNQGILAYFGFVKTKPHGVSHKICQHPMASHPHHQFLFTWPQLQGGAPPP